MELVILGVAMLAAYVVLIFLLLRSYLKYDRLSHEHEALFYEHEELRKNYSGLKLDLDRASKNDYKDPVTGQFAKRPK